MMKQLNGLKQTYKNRHRNSIVVLLMVVCFLLAIGLGVIAIGSGKIYPKKFTGMGIVDEQTVLVSGSVNTPIALWEHGIFAIDLESGKAIQWDFSQYGYDTGSASWNSTSKSLIIDSSGIDRPPLILRNGDVQSNSLPSVNRWQWLANGRKLISVKNKYISRNTEKNSTITIYDLETDESQVVWDKNGYSISISLAESDTTIFVTAWNATTDEEELFRLNLVDQSTERLFEAWEGDVVDPSYSPSGHLMGFLHRGTGNGTVIRAIDEEGGVVTLVENQGQYLSISDFKWVSDDEIAFFARIDKCEPDEYGSLTICIGHLYKSNINTGYVQRVSKYSFLRTKFIH